MSPQLTHQWFSCLLRLAYLVPGDDQRNPFRDLYGHADPNYEVIGPDVFRFEYYYLLSSSPSVGTANQLSAGPWTSTDTFSVKDVAAIVVAIAVIEPKSRVLLSYSEHGKACRDKWPNVALG